MFDFIRKPMLWEAWDAGLDKEIGETTFQLKSMQDLAVYSLLRGTSGQRVGEVGAGKSRLLSTLAKENSCVAIEKYEGQGGGPTTAPEIPGVEIVRAFLGENSPELADGSFDAVLSISVVEHVPTKELAAFHADQLRTLKPGGIFIHAIDLYIADDFEDGRFATFRSWVTSDGVEPLGEVYEGPCRFTCDMATNPDNIMYAWGRIAPKLIELRQRAQGVSLLVGGRKLG